MKLTDLSQHSF